MSEYIPNYNNVNGRAIFQESSKRANLTSGEPIPVSFGKIKKWFSDLGDAAFRDVDSYPVENSQDLITSGAVYSIISPNKDGEVLFYSIETDASSETYTATEDCNVVALNLDVNGEASDETLGSGISTTGTTNGSYTDSANHSGVVDRNYSVTIKSISLTSGQTVAFSHGSSHSGSYTTQIHVILKAKNAYTTLTKLYFSSKADSGVSKTEVLSSASDCFAFSVQTKGTDASGYSGILTSLLVSTSRFSDISSSGDIPVSMTNKVVSFLGSLPVDSSITFSAQSSSGYTSQTTILLSLS